jgi:hypothetical protein
MDNTPKKVSVDTSVTPQNIAKWGVGISLLILLGYGFTTYILPTLISLTWGLIELAVGGFILFSIFMLFSNPRFWRTLKYLNEALTKIMLFWLIEFDEFIIQEEQIKQAENDVEDFVKAKEKIEGVRSKLQTTIIDKDRLYLECIGMSQAAENAGDNDASEQYALDAVAHKTYIDSVSPLVNDMDVIIGFSDKMEKVMARKIKDLKRELNLAKDTYFAISAGASALSSAKKAIFGDKNINNDSELAKQRLINKTAQLTGELRNSMKILKEVQTEESYRDKSKMLNAKKQIMEITSTVEDTSFEVIQPRVNTVTRISSKFGGIL